MERKSKPNWWIVFALVPLMIVAIQIESQFRYAVQIHKIIDCGIVMVTFGLMAVWVRVNQTALMEEENAKEKWILIEESDDAEVWQFELPIDSIPDSVYASSPQRPRTNVGLRITDINPSKGGYN